MANQRGPEYELPTLIADCGSSGLVWISGGALASAQSDFRLATADEVRAFIADNGLERPRHISTVPWEKNPDPRQVIWVDSYSFYSGPIFGYFAFSKGLRSKWIVKSCKKNDRPDPRFLPMRAALERLK